MHLGNFRMPMHGVRRKKGQTTTNAKFEKKKAQREQHVLFEMIFIP